MTLQIKGSISYRAKLGGTISGSKKLSARIVRGGGGVSSYNDLTDLPSINGETVEGDKNGHDYGLANLSDIPSIPVYNLIKQTLYNNTNGCELNTLYQLNDNIDNYDFIEFSITSREDDTGGYGMEYNTVLGNELLSYGIYHFSGYGTRWITVSISNDSFTIINSGGDQTLRIFKIVGIKLGAIV